MGDKRKIEQTRIQISNAPTLKIKVKIGDAGESTDFSNDWVGFEFTAMLNQGEAILVDLVDPYFTVNNTLVGNIYYKYSRKFAPITTNSQIGWLDTENKTEAAVHNVTNIKPSGAGDNKAHITFLGVDQPSFYLIGGDAGGKSIEGNVKKVIEELAGDYGLSVDFRGETNDSKKNRWWTYRLSPKTVIMSVLEWASAVSDKKTRWYLYPDDAKLIVQEQGAVQSKHRATYMWRGLGSDTGGLADIMEWELLGDNFLEMYETKILTAGISAVSGAYYDHSQEKYQDAVAVRDSNTANKLKPKTTDSNAFTKPDSSQGSTPDDVTVGYTMMPAIPELSAGDLGIRYDKYFDGLARTSYLRLLETLLRVRIRVMGHGIWSGSEGLGADTIDIIMTTADNKKHFLFGNWIVYGFKHIVSRDTWTTDLYCFRIDYDAAAKGVGK